MSHHLYRFRRFWGLVFLALTLGVRVPLPLAWGGERAWLPIAFLSPENGLGAGLKGIAKNPWRGVERLDAHAYFTSRAQFETKVATRFGSREFWGHPRLGFEAFYTPFSYYGKGNNPPEERRILYAPVGGRLSAETVFPLGYSWHMRLAAMAQGISMSSLRADGGDSVLGEVLPLSTPGRQGGRQDLGEIVLEWDTRDDEDLPSHGLHTGVRMGHSSPLSEFDYGRWEFFLVQYLQPWPSVELAGKFGHRGVFGQAPFYDWPALGERKILRGIPDRRLRDRQAQAIQGEARHAFQLALPGIAQWFGETWQIAAFAELGRVENGMRALSRAQWHPSGGFGGRLFVGKRLGALRGDIGFSGYGFGIYVDFNQAF